MGSFSSLNSYTLPSAATIWNATTWSETIPDENFAPCDPVAVTPETLKLFETVPESRVNGGLLNRSASSTSLMETPNLLIDKRYFLYQLIVLLYSPN